MNKAAPGFFFLAQHAWWNDIILHIFRMTDRDRRVLSILKLSVPPALTTGFLARLTTLKTATKFAHRLRHEYIAHRNREVALEVRPVPPSSVADVNGAIAALDDALQFIDHHFTKREPTMYEHLDILGGSESLIWIVRRGLAARDEDIEQFRRSCAFLIDRLHGSPQFPQAVALSWPDWLKRGVFAGSSRHWRDNLSVSKLSRAAKAL